MKLNLVPARTGAAWVRLGLRTFWRQPLAFISLFFLFMALMSIASQIPLLGSVIAPILLPFMTLALMVATSVAYAGTTGAAVGAVGSPGAPSTPDSSNNSGSPPQRQRPIGSTMFVATLQAMRTEWRALLVLGLISAVYFIAAVALSALIDGGQLARAYLLDDPLTPEIMAGSEFQTARLLVMCLNLPLSLAMWHAPALVHWYRVEPVKSIFFSVVGLFRNFGAYALFGLAWFGVFLVAGIAIGLAATVLVGLGAIGVGEGATAIGSALMIGSALVLAAMSLSSTWFTFRDTFTE
jgi:hypothetical protein